MNSSHELRVVRRRRSRTRGRRRRRARSAIARASFARADRPFGLRWTTLRQSSTQPTAPKPSVTSSTTQTKRLSRSPHSSVVIDDRHQDQRAAHRRRAGLDEVRLRAVVAHRLADLHPRQPRDHPRADDERDDERGHRRQHRAQRDVAEHVERADVLARATRSSSSSISAPPPPSRRSSAATTRSMRMKREPLTSSVVARARVRARAAPTSASTSAKCMRARAERRDGFARVASPTAYRRVDAALARVLADLAVERRPLRADLAHVAHHEAAARPAPRRARRSPRAPNRDWRCTCRRARRAPRRGAHAPRAGPRTARNAASPRAIGGERRAGGERGRRGGERVARHVPPGTASVTSQRAAAVSRSRASLPSARSVDARAARRPPRRARTSPRARPRARAAARQTSRHARRRRSAPRRRRGGSAAIASACSAATSATLAMNSWCSRCALLTTDDRRLRDRGELARLAAMVHAELDHRGAMRVASGAAASAAGRSRC